MQKLEHPYKPISSNSIRKADAIVVLSGMLHQIGDKNYNTYEFSDPDRFFGGLDLIKKNKSNIIILLILTLTSRILPFNTLSLFHKFIVFIIFYRFSPP